MDHKLWVSITPQLMVHGPKTVYKKLVVRNPDFFNFFLTMKIDIYSI